MVQVQVMLYETFFGLHLRCLLLLNTVIIIKAHKNHNNLGLINIHYVQFSTNISFITNSNLPISVQ